MASLTLTASLFDLVPEPERAQGRARRSVSLAARSWQDVAHELRRRAPQLAQRILTDSGSIAEGFLVALNGAVLDRGQSPPELAESDELHVLAQMAGG